MELTRDFCEQLDGLVGPQLTLLASDICEQFTINRRISGSVGDDLFLFLSANLWRLEHCVDSENAAQGQETVSNSHD